MKHLDEATLKDLYLSELLNPYEIGTKLGCNHKTVRSYLRKYGIQMRLASEYNYLPRTTHEQPPDELLRSSLSIAGHVAYLCEGYHTEKSDGFQFVNQDPQMIDLEIMMLKTVYKARKLRIRVVAACEADAAVFLALYPEARYQKDTSRKNPIIRLHCGGKRLVRDVVQNAYKLLETLSS